MVSPCRSARRLRFGLAIAVAVTFGVLRDVSSAPAAPAALVGATAYIGAFQPGLSSTTPAPSGSVVAAVGRSFGVVRVYDHWDDPEPSYSARSVVAAGATPIVSIDPLLPNGTWVAWSAIASGADDARIRAQAAGLRSLGARVILSFQHEPEYRRHEGTPADYVAAWRHYVAVFRAAQARNVRFAEILSSRTYATPAIHAWYAGDDVVAYPAADGYNGDGCNGGPAVWRPFSTIFTPLRAFAESRHKRAVIGEWASTEARSDPYAKAAWITAAGATLAAWPEIHAAVYFDTGGKGTSCHWPLTSSPAALEAFARLAANPSLNPFPQARLVLTTPAVGPNPMAATFDTAGTATTPGTTMAWHVAFGDSSHPLAGTGSIPALLHHTYGPGRWTARLAVADSAGRVAFTTVTLVVLPPPGCYRTGPLIWVGPASATVTAMVDPKGQPTTFRAEWGPTRSYGHATAPARVGGGTAPVPVRATMSGLMPGTYHWHLVASNASGSTSTPDATFVLRP